MNKKTAVTYHQHHSGDGYQNFRWWAFYEAIEGAQYGATPVATSAFNATIEFVEYLKRKLMNNFMLLEHFVWRKIHWFNNSWLPTPFMCWTVSSLHSLISLCDFSISSRVSVEDCVKMSFPRRRRRVFDDAAAWGWSKENGVDFFNKKGIFLSDKFWDIFHIFKKNNFGIFLNNNFGILKKNNWDI